MQSKWLAYISIVIIGSIFGYWFATEQVLAVGESALLSYPTPYFLLTMAKCALIVFMFAAFSQLILSQLTKVVVSPWVIAGCYFPLVFVHSLPLLRDVFFIILSLHLIACFVVIRANRLAYFPPYIRVDALVLLGYFLLNFFFTTRFSPLNWANALLVADGFNSEEIPILAPVFKSYVLAKQFSFTNIDHAQWAGIMNPPVSLNSPLLQMIAFIGNLPSLSYDAYHAVLMAVYFILAILSSFSLYLFLKYAAKVHIVFAIFGGFLAFFGGAPILSDAFTSDGGIFLSSYAVLPLAMLAISLAFDKSTIIHAVWAGFFLASQFTLSTPHPEAVIYSLLFFGIYTLGLLLYSDALNLQRRFKLAALSVLTFFVISLPSIAPIMADRLMGNMYVFAHVGDVHRIAFSPFTRYFILYAVSVPLSYYLLKGQKVLTPVYRSALMLTTVLLAIILFARSTALINLLIRLTHIGLHFWVVSRVGMYFCMSLVVLSMFALQGLLNALVLTYFSKSGKLRE